MSKQPRVVAVAIVQAVLSGQSLTAAFEQHVSKVSLSQQAYVKAIGFGVIRHYQWLECVLRPLLEKPLKKKDQDLHVLLLIGLYELIEQKTADYAVVSETVNGAKAFNKMWAKGLVNGVLRSFLRQQPALVQGCEKSPTSFYRHPNWLIDAIKGDWPDDWVSILMANNQHAPMVIRVNQQKTTREAYLALLQEAEIKAAVQPETTMGIQLSQAVDVTLLPNFAQGWCSVQDGAAQMAAELLQLQPGLRVLDACAAPGGKTCHIAESEPNLAELIALDVDSERLTRVVDNLQRLSVTAKTQQGDFSKPGLLSGMPMFDRILLDAPCTGTGVIRRHPDIKLLRKKHDVVALSQLQHTMLENAWSVLTSGGRLVYATCSVLKQENEQQVASFVAEQEDATLLSEHRILPGELNRDGFYYACLEKD